MGEWDADKKKYKSINQDNIDWAKDTIQGLLDTWGTHEALYAIEPVNEPWFNSDFPTLKAFYRDVREMMKEQQPRLKFVFHDAFHFSPIKWNSLFADDDMENVIMDTHQYIAWSPKHHFVKPYCAQFDIQMAPAKLIKYPIWVGEWSLATDVCA